MVELRKLIVGALALAAVGAQAQELKSEELVKKVAPSVVTLVVTGSDGGSTVGSGFFALRDGVAVTAWHVVEKATKVTARLSTGEEFEVSGLVDKDEKRDVALIRVKVAGRPMLTLSSKEPAVGSKAFVVDASQGSECSISDALIGQVQVVEGVKQIQFSCPVMPGNSGGPLLDSTGAVVGVVSCQVKDGQNLSFAVPAIYAQGLDHSLPTKPWSSSESKTTAGPSALTDAAMDKLLADALDAFYNALVAYLQTDEAWAVRKGYEGGVPMEMYTRMRRASSAVLALEEAVSSDPARVELSKALQTHLTMLLSAMGMSVDAGKEAVRHVGWTPKALDLDRQADSLFNDHTEWIANLESLAAKTPALGDRCSKAVRVLLGLEELGRRFPLGAMSLTDYNPCYMAVVQKGLPAWTMGFRPDDIVLRLNGLAVKDLWDLRAKLSERKGRDVTATVRRAGKNKDLKFKVPADLGGD